MPTPGAPARQNTATRLVPPLARRYGGATARDSLDGFVLPDHLGANALGEVFGIDRDQVLAALFVSLLQAGLVGEPIENVHDEPREVGAFVKEDGDRCAAGADHQRDGEWGRCVIDGDQCE